MNGENEIKRENEELKKQFPLLFGLEKKNPFAAPENYFDDVEMKISLQVNESIISVPIAIGIGTEDMPENYFDDLEEKIKNKIALDDLKKENYTIPENYFVETEADLNTIIKLEALKSNAFVAPENYLENAEELIKTNVWLSELKNDFVFSLPEDYFETLEARIREKVGGQKKEARIINMSSAFKKFRYVAAAAIIIGVCLFSWLIFRNDNVGVEIKQVQLSALDKKKIIENPEEFGIDDNTVAALIADNPELLSDGNIEISDEAMNEIVLDQNIDISTITGD
jgi:hypothetical protein